MKPKSKKEILKFFKKIEKAFIKGDHLKYPVGHVIKVMLSALKA